jgi:2-haloacid dehalogenase
MKSSCVFVPLLLFWVIVNKEKCHMHIQTVIFDLGGVLIDWNPRYLYRKLMKSEAEMEYFLANICTPAWNAQQDAGRPFHEGVAVLIKQHPQHRALIEAYRQRWEEMLGGELGESVAIFRQIKSTGLPIYALTNWSAETFHPTQKKFGFLHEFDGIVFSGKEKVAKPDPRLFHILLERYKIEASTALYIDDNADNIITAKQLGLHTIHFQNAPQLRQALQELKVL